MIYEFIDESKHLYLTSRPAEAMQFNGQYLEDLVTGYKTVNVMGRESLSLAVSTSGGLPARDGEIIENVVVSARNIVVTYSLTASTNEEFRLAYDTLKHHLMTSPEPVPIKFDDDPDYTYYGIVSSIPEVEPGVNTVVGEINIFCADPYKYADEASIMGTGSVTYSPLGLTQPVRPIIQITLGSAATTIVITNATTGKKIILNGSYAIGDVVVIDAAIGSVTRNGGSIKTNLDYVESDFFHFLVSLGDQIVVDPVTTSIQLTYRRRLL